MEDFLIYKYHSCIINYALSCHLNKLRCISELTGMFQLLNILCLHLKDKKYCYYNMLDQQLWRIIQLQCCK